MTDPKEIAAPEDAPAAADQKPASKSTAYVWQVLRPEDVPAMEAALGRLKTYTLADHAKLRVVDRSATGKDAWDHAYMAGNPLYTHAAIMDWGQEYTKTTSDMSTAWEFFLCGWKAHAKLVADTSKKVDLKREAQWVVRLGIRYNYAGHGRVAITYAGNADRWPSHTFDLDKAHPFKSRKEAQAFLDALSDGSSSLHGDEKWEPTLGQRNDFR